MLRVNSLNGFGGRRTASASLLVTDDFSGYSEGANISSDARWTLLNETEIVNQSGIARMEFANSQGRVYHPVAPANNQLAYGTLGILGTSNAYAAMLLHIQDSLNYMSARFTGVGNVEIYVVEGGVSITPIATGTFTNNEANLLRFEVSGGIYTAKVDGDIKVSIADSTFSSGYAGWGFRRIGGGAGHAGLTDVAIGDL